VASNSITILHDSFGAVDGLARNWGFAALVEFEGRRILFDTGNNAEAFRANVGAIGADLARLDAVVISHRHGDHTTGLAQVIALNPQVPVWVPRETYGVFGSSLPGTFYPRCPTLPASMRYFDGFPPELIRHGTPWPDAAFRHVDSTCEIWPGVSVVHTVSEVPGTREMPELTLSLWGPQGQVIVAGCSHPGIEKILAAAGAPGTPVLDLFGGLHLVLTPPEQIERLAGDLRAKWGVKKVSPGHCTGEPGFDVLRRVFDADYAYAGLGSRLTF
jgi:7,8-dihydropterin-6-yl-methyl-4-(beta-D-ribofuranosyl)aminobenzene 5'-phosphate synthase